MDHALKLHLDNSQDTSKEPKEVCPRFFFPVKAKIQCACQNTSLHRMYMYVYSVNVCCPLMYRCSH